YWGPNSSRNVASCVVGNQLYVRAHLMGILLTLQHAPLAVSIRILTRRKQTIDLVVGSARQHKSCGWRCTNGDILKVINEFVCARTAALEFRL
ncbi:hypothetical protein EV421DRAFT_1697410, partial [Armillaria borealis]